MTREEQTIRNVWERTLPDHDWKRRGPILRVAVRQPLEGTFTEGPVPDKVDFEYVEFRLEFGRYEGQPAYRVTGTYRDTSIEVETGLTT